MSLWHALRLEMSSDWTVVLLVGLLVTALVTRMLAPHEHRRVGTVSFLFVLQCALTAGAAVLEGTQGHAQLDVRLAALIVAALAGVGMAGSIVGIIMNRTRFPVPTIVRDVFVAAASLVAVFTIAARMGVDLSSVVATSAVVTAVIGFSLADTLGNIMGGLALQLDSSVQIGDWVKIGDLRGRVTEIKWRYTAIETRNWETVVVPNSILMKGQVVVEGRRTEQPVQLRRWVWFNVDFRTAPTDVITAVADALHDCQIPGVAAEPPPNCILMDLHESYGKYAVRYWLTDMAKDDPTDSLIRTRVFFALKRANIPLSIPAVAAFVTEESTGRKVEKGHNEHDHRMAALAKVELFSSLPEDVRARIADCLHPAPFSAGEIITRQGAEAHYLYLVISGEVSVRMSHNGAAQKEVKRLKNGGFFGEMSLLTGIPRTATLVALTSVDCYRLDRPIAKEILTQRPEFAEHLAEILAQRRMEMDQTREELDHDARAKLLSASKSDFLERIRHFFSLDEADATAPAETGTGR